MRFLRLVIGKVCISLNDVHIVTTTSLQKSIAMITSDNLKHIKSFHRGMQPKATGWTNHYVSNYYVGRLRFEIDYGQMLSHNHAS